MKYSFGTDYIIIVWNKRIFESYHIQKYIKFMTYYLV